MWIYTVLSCTANQASMLTALLTRLLINGEYSVKGMWCTLVASYIGGLCAQSSGLTSALRLWRDLFPSLLASLLYLTLNLFQCKVFSNFTLLTSNFFLKDHAFFLIHFHFTSALLPLHGACEHHAASLRESAQVIYIYKSENRTRLSSLGIIPCDCFSVSVKRHPHSVLAPYH